MPIVAAGLLTVFAVGCGGSSSSDSTSAPTSTAPSSVLTTPDTSGSVSTEGTSAPASTDAAPGALDDEAIRTAFTTFFSGTGHSVDERVAALQNGETYREMIEGAAADPRFQSLSVDIREIREVPSATCETATGEASCAAVTFDLLVSGMPMLAGHDGYAVNVDGTWVVASSAWCDVVSIGGEGEACP